jgi:predicted nucleic acid-binding protein
VLPLTMAMHEAAVELAARDGLSIYDAMIVSAAVAAGCNVLYSEDMQDGRVFPTGLTIRNPFS